MQYWLTRGVVLAIMTLPVAVVSGYVRPLLGVAFFVTALSALSLNGTRATLASIPLRPADADDPVSPPAIARVLHKMICGHTIFLAAMSVAFVIAAVLTVEPPVRTFAASFAVAALAAGPGTAVRRRLGQRVAVVAVVAGLLVWWLRTGRLTQWSLLACGLALTVLACGNSAGLVDGGRDGADPAEGPVDHAPLDALSSDQAAGDTPSYETSEPIDWDAALECDAMSCAAGDLCIRWQGGVDGAQTMSTCHHVPDDCVAYPSCDCIKAFVLECSSQCRSEGPRRFTCGEGI